MDEATRTLIAKIEASAAQGAARNASALAPHAAGGLAGLAESLLATPAPTIALVTGYWVNGAAETDGPVGAALLARLFRSAGWRVVAATDLPCRAPLGAAFAWSGLAPDDLFVAGAAGETAQAWLAARGVTHVLAIERPGAASNGRYYNMRGKDISGHVHRFDDLFEGDQPWITAAIGDGGNEIGMGSIPRDVIAKAIDHGRKIASATPARFTLVCGVSNWGAYALAAALVALSDEFRRLCGAVFTDAAELEIMRRLLESGAVDGVLGKAAISVDGMGMDAHFAKRADLFGMVAL